MRGLPPAILATQLIAPSVCGQAAKRYEIVKETVRVSGAYVRPSPETERDEIVIDVTFQLRSLLADDDPDSSDTIVITENGRELGRVPLKTVKARSLTAMLAMDVSGSMARASGSGREKMQEARDAALHFLDRLPARADVGLVLFDHRVQPSGIRYPSGDPENGAFQRGEVARMIREARPEGGTAYLDATAQALSVLGKYRGERAVVLMTDGIDMNSRRSAEEVVKLAEETRVPVYVLGVGDPGWNEPVSSVLVLDHSASMAAPAGGGDKTRMEALHEAASRFVDLMRDGSQATLLPFSSRVELPDEFTTDREDLRRRIQRLRPSGGTAVYDATFTGIETAVATRPKGRRYVVVLTDGVDEDPGSRHGPEDVIRLARDEGVKVFMLGLGRREDINEAEMKRIAESTGGRYDHAGNQEELIRLFEQLSLDLHGDGIDEKALQELAQKTGGRYYRARDASDLRLIYGTVAGELQSTYTLTFPSLSQRMDAVVRAVDIYVVDREGRAVSDVIESDSARAGLVVSDFGYVAYLILLAGLLGLLWLPSALRGRVT